LQQLSSHQQHWWQHQRNCQTATQRFTEYEWLYQRGDDDGKADKGIKCGDEGWDQPQEEDDVD